MIIFENGKYRVAVINQDTDPNSICEYDTEDEARRQWVIAMRIVNGVECCPSDAKIICNTEEFFEKGAIGQ